MTNATSDTQEEYWTISDRYCDTRHLREDMDDRMIAGIDVDPGEYAAAQIGEQAAQDAFSAFMLDHQGECFVVARPLDLDGWRLGEIPVMRLPAVGDPLVRDGETKAYE